MAGAVGGVWHRAALLASLQSSLQSEEVHAAPIVCLPGAQAILESRLSGRRSVARRQSRAAGRHRPEGNARLHDLAEGFATVAQTVAGAAVARRDHLDRAAHESAQAE